MSASALNEPIEGEFNIPDTVEYIEQDAFLGQNIDELTIDSNNLARIKEGAFHNNNLEEIHINAPNLHLQKDLFDGNDITTAYLNVEKIGDEAFRDYRTTTTGSIIEQGSLEDLTLGDSVEEIGEKAFYGNNITGELTLPHGIVLVDRHAFGSNSINGLDVEQGVETLGCYSFEDNNIAGTLELPQSIDCIGTYAFDGNKIEVLDIDTDNENLDTIYHNAFRSNSLTEIHLNPVVDTIGERAFAFNGNVEKITIGEDVTVGGDYANQEDSFERGFDSYYRNESNAGTHIYCTNNESWSLE